MPLFSLSNYTILSPFSFSTKRAPICTISQLILVLVLRHLSVEPFQQVFHFSVDTKLARASTSITPAGSAMQIVLPSGLTNHWSPTIPLTGVYSSLVQTCTDHGVMNLPWVGSITTSTTDHWNLNLLKIVRRSTPRSKSAPARDPAYGTFSWFGDGIRKTYQVNISKDEKSSVSVR